MPPMARENNVASKLHSARLAVFHTRVISLIVICAMVATISAEGRSPVVCFSSGCVKGKSMTGYQRPDEFDAFLGIPYARPPIGDFRFREPMPVIAWSDQRSATDEPPICIQKNYLMPDPVIMGSEDCLYLNVYRPMEAHARPLPVMAYIHGGGFFSGWSGSLLHGPEYIMDTGDVILVTMNYRLAVFGFLSTGDEHSPGNYALKDQSFALRWIQNNIAAFGGDPNAVTIFGQSAGGASVHMHMLSPLSTGLFHRAIVQSGNAIAPYNVPIKNPLQQARQQAEFVGISNARHLTTEQLIAALRQCNATTLVNSGDRFKFWSVDPLVTYRTVVEPNLPGAFLTADPRAIMRSGNYQHVPWMTGTVPQEGIVRAGAIVSNKTLLRDLNGRFNELIPKLMELNRGSRKWISDKLAAIKQFYFNGTDEITEANGQRFIDMFTDRAFMSPMHKSIRHYLQYADTERAPVFLYRFAFNGPLSYSMLFTGTQNDFGVGHCDELIYLFRSPILFPNFEFAKTGADANMIQKLVRTFVHFAVTGTPYPWANVRPCTKNTSTPFCDYIEFNGSTKTGVVKVKVNNHFDKEAVKFWNGADVELF